MSSNNTTIQEKKKYFIAKELVNGMNKMIRSFSQDPKEPNVNIFKSYQQSHTKNFQKINLGPTIDKEGNVVSRSILGKPEDFQRLHQIKSKSISMLSSGQKQNAAQKLLERRKSKQDILKKNNLETLTQKESLKELDQSTVSKRSSKIPTKESSPLIKKKNGRSDVQVYTKFFLIEQMKQTQKKIEDNQKKTEELLNTLPIQTRHSMTREGRTDEHFQDSQSNWMETSSKLALKTGRQPYETLIQKSTLYREKVEERMINENHSQIPLNFWENNLRNEFSRKSNIKQLQSQGFLSEDQNTEKEILQQGYFNLPNRVVEIIRPFTINNDKYTSSQMGLNKISRTRIISNMSKTSQSSFQTITIKPSRRTSTVTIGDPEFNKLHELQLNGVSVMQKELEAFKNDGNDIWTNYQKYKKTDQDQCDEVLCSNWNIKELSRNSKSDLPKIANKIY